MRHSLAGGATLHPRQVAGLWGSEHRSAINILEMLAVSNALQYFRSNILGRAVLVRCDNATVVAYINHRGGTRSGRLCALAWDLIHWCIRHGVTLSAVHLPGEENVTADALSRGWIVPMEWSLLPQVARSLFLLIGPWPSRANNQTTDLLCKETRPQRVADRRAGVSVGRPAGLCLSTFLPYPSGVGQYRAGELPSPPHSPVLAPPAVVSQANQSSGSPPGDSSHGGQIYDTNPAPACFIRLQGICT